MKKATSIILAFALVLYLAVGVFASTGEVQKTLFYNNIKITLNGNELTPKDANGNTVEPFVIDGTTYLPVRAVSEALGLDVQWDGATNTVNLSDKTSASAPQTPSKSEYRIGDTWTVPGQWSLTITGVRATTDRNPYSDKNPAAVYIVDYTYTNIGYEADYWDGLFMSIDDTIVDSAGKMGYSYPGDVTYYAQETPVGATCQAQGCIGVDNAGTFRLTITQYDGTETRQSAVFVVDVP